MSFCFFSLFLFSFYYQNATTNNTIVKIVKLHSYAGQSMVVNDIFPPIMCESSSESEHSDYGQYDDNGDDDDEADSCFEEGDFDRSSSKQRFNSKPKFKQRSSGRCKECDQPELQFPCDIEY